MTKTISKFSVAIALFLFAAVSMQAKSISAYYDAPYTLESSVKANLKKRVSPFWPLTLQQTKAI